MCNLKISVLSVEHISRLCIQFAFLQHRNKIAVSSECQYKETKVSAIYYRENFRFEFKYSIILFVIPLSRFIITRLALLAGTSLGRFVGLMGGGVSENIGNFPKNLHF